MRAPAVRHIFSLVIHVGNGHFRTKCPECLRASPGNRVFIGNANDQAFLAFEKFGFHCRKHTEPFLLSDLAMFRDDGPQCLLSYARLGGDLWRRRRLAGPKRDFRLHALKPDAAHLLIRFQYRLLQLHCRLGAVRAPIQKKGSRRRFGDCGTPNQIPLDWAISWFEGCPPQLGFH